MRESRRAVQRFLAAGLVRHVVFEPQVRGDAGADGDRELAQEKQERRDHVHDGHAAHVGDHEHDGVFRARAETCVRKEINRKSNQSKRATK